MEKQILSLMLGIVSPKTVGADVKIQLIQTLSVMIENIRTPGSLCNNCTHTHTLARTLRA